MGIYINHRHTRKEQWLADHGTAMPQPLQHRLGDNVAVCLADNGGFTAAGVAYSQGELDAFSYPDGRVKRWYMVPIAELVEVGAIQSADDIRAEA